MPIGRRARGIAPRRRGSAGRGRSSRIAIIIAVADALGRARPGRVVAYDAVVAGFWLGMMVFLAIQPVADFLIFRGLWPLPLTGLGALFRKSASNELLFGYSGELQFYLWARRHAAIPGSPFGAVRDVAVLSALAGNVVTIALLLAAIALPGRSRLRVDGRIRCCGRRSSWSDRRWR